MTSRPIADGVFTDAPVPRLLAGRCEACEVVTFPRQGGCPRCTRRSVVDHWLPPAGVLWSWTIQRFAPKAPYRGPAEFVPYGVGYVELPGECIVEGRLTTADPDELWIGRPMELTLVVNHVDGDGADVMTYAFAPSGTR
ncbi:Zn-ribbon domain-containing OB-fold protein [Nocardioides litoris]|uniref:Zn-ribbon domain-containing OB-fold protein n=1 Tax=Nocardioides litoris TaxID=1926648 RepID=UPI0011225E61|nr:OB-fold domain-containing protein [Nocardioides litoris]